MARCHAGGRAGHNPGCVSAPGAGLSSRAGCEERPARCASVMAELDAARVRLIPGGSLSARAGMRRGCIYLSCLGMYREWPRVGAAPNKLGPALGYAYLISLG